MSRRIRIRHWVLGFLFIAALAAPALVWAEIDTNAPGTKAGAPGSSKVDAKSGGATAHTEKKGGLGTYPALAAALAIGLSALGTAFAQARIGAAGMGALAENPKQLGAVIMLIAIPETVAILGFVIAYLIITS